VHTVLGFSSLLLVVIGSLLLLGMLRALPDWSKRRLIQVLVLMMPLLTLGIGMSGLHHFIGHPCLTTIPFWDFLPGVIVPLGMVIVALGALVLGGLRLLLMRHLVRCCRMPVSLSFQQWMQTLEKRLGISSTRIQICAYQRPLALTCGSVRPTILLSTWMLSNLDQHELEAVLMHELEHVARHDYLIIFLATVLRDAFFYMPTSWMAYRQLQREKELVCDDLTVKVTQRPLALASALAKVWLYAAEMPQAARFGAAQPLVERERALNTRIDRLLAQQPTTHIHYSRAVMLSICALAPLILFVIQGVNFLIILSLLHCNPLALLSTLF
jgi:beta-lactamase regulating signal transducer with metallopeptidase domain